MNGTAVLLIAGVILTGFPSAAEAGGHPASSHGQAGHICGTDLSSPEARRDLEYFRAARDRGDLVRARKFASPPSIGDRRTFRVSEGGWVSLEFELRDREDNLYNLWVAVDELATGRITQQVISDLRSALVETTPGSIINPNAGVMSNNEALLGPPPDYDGDGVTDVLMYDIEPNDDTPGSFIAGYVSSVDINPNASSGSGNQADVLYLDSNQGITSGVTASTAAHEYAHLIHFATGFDTDTFISEGIAEYMTVANGLGRSGYSFLALASETALPLFTWRSGGSEVLRDYARAELFFRYIGEQLSPQAVAGIASNRYKSAAGIDSVLRGLGTSLAQVVADYHSANLVNDARLDPRFAYGPGVEASGVRAGVSTTYSGSVAESTPPFASGSEPRLESGAANYILLTNVADVSIEFDAVSAPILLNDARRLLAARAFVLDEFGEERWVDLKAGQGPSRLAGNFYRVRVAFANVRPGITAVSRYTYEAGWAPFGQATTLTDPAELPSAMELGQNHPNPFNPVTSIGFAVPSSGPVRLSVHDHLGRRVALLVDGNLTAGSHSVQLDGSHLASGTYVYVLEAGGQRMSRLLTLIK